MHTTSIEDYTTLAASILTSEALLDARILKAITVYLEKGATREEAVMHAYLYDIALQLEKARHDYSQMVMTLYSIPPVLSQFKQWREEGRIHQQPWTQDLNAIMKVGTINEEQSQWIAKVLQELT